MKLYTNLYLNVEYFIDGLEVLNLGELAAVYEDCKKQLVLEVILEQVM